MLHYGCFDPPFATMFLALSMLSAFSISSCQSLPKSGKIHTIQLYSRGIEQKEIGTLRLNYTYYAPNAPGNYFYAELYTVPNPIEKIQIPQRTNIHPKQDASDPGYNPNTGKSYLNVQTPIPEAFFEGSTIFQFRIDQPFHYRDSRKVERLLLISTPDPQNQIPELILSLDFYLFPNKRGYLLRLDLRTAENFHRRISPETPVDQVAGILSYSEHEAIFHNQTLVGQAQYF